MSFSTSLRTSFARGEAGTVGALPAIVNAVVDALAPIGVKGLDMPATSERIWQANINGGVPQQSLELLQ